jgi:Zn-dependent protease with chaperone function
MPLAATWYDGQTSRARAVRLSCVQAAMQLEFDDDGSRQAWPLETVAISPRLGSTPRILRLPDGARVEVADSLEIEAWFQGAGGAIQTFADWLERRRMAIAASAALVLVATVLFLRFGMPWMARELAERMPSAVERHVSDQVVTLLERVHFAPSRLDAGRRAALDRRFRALVAGEPRSADMRVSFVHAPRLGPNAFALPDGRIFVTDALVRLAGSEEEVLAVLAHEAGHHVHRHGMRGALESSSMFVIAGLLFGDASGSSLAVSIPATLLTSGFSRGYEREADAYAFDLLRRRGQSPKAFATIMQRLSADVPDGLERGPLGYLSTHPPSPERIEKAERAASGH